MRKVFLGLVCGLFFMPTLAPAQIVHAVPQQRTVNTAPAIRQKNNVAPVAVESEAEAKSRPEPERQRMTGRMRDYGDQREARNIKIVEAVAHYKLGDVKLREEFDNLENNREYNEKMQKIMDKLSNDRFRDSKNKQVITILQEAGNKLYNLLAD